MRDLSIHVLGQGQPEHGPAPRALNRHSISKVFRLGLLRLIGVSRQAEQDRNPGQLPHHAVTFASFPASGGIGARYPTTSSNTPVPMNETIRSRVPRPERSTSTS